MKNWIQSMSVGNAFLDAEHRKLLGMIEDVEQAIRAKDSALFLMQLKTFKDAVHIHFKNEEIIAKKIGHVFDRHKAEHQYVLDELQQMETELIGMDGKWSESASTHYFIFLSAWASEHINEDDMLMKPELQDYSYDFRPNELIES